MRCLIQFAQAHDEFRLPELFSVAKLFGITLPVNPDDNAVDITRPFLIIELEEAEAKLLAGRCILIRFFFFDPGCETKGH
jgi:tRNA (guanine10-N2)-methyltransferase